MVEPNRFILRELKRKYGRVIYVLYHGQLFLGTYFAKDERVTTIISQHRDGEYIFQIARRLGIKAVRGSSTRGGAAAVHKLATSSRYAADNIGITPDGPRGPAGSVKNGVIFLAKMLGAPIVPVSIVSSSAWKFETWDKFHLPRPFSLALLLLGRPLQVENNAGPDELEEKRRILERDLRDLNARAEERMELLKTGHKKLFNLGRVGPWIRGKGTDYMNRDSERWWSPPLTLLLCPVELLFRFSVRIRDHLYQSGILRTRSLPLPVISVGNISVGGTGKTMMVSLLANFLAEQGFRVAILTRGYGGRESLDVEVIPHLEETRNAAISWGDEPVYLASKLPDSVVVRGKDRFLGGLKAAARYGCDVCILDDGFQFRRLNRDIDIVMLHGERPFGSGWLLPAGNLREGPRSLQRADLLVECARWGGEGNGKSNILERKDFRGIPRVRVSLAAGTIHPLGQEEVIVDKEELIGKKIVAFAGIGDPRSFQYLIETFFPSSIQFLTFPDHHIYTRRSTERLNQEFDRLKADIMVTTEKDAIKLRAQYFEDRPCWVISSRLDIDEGMDILKELLSIVMVRSKERQGHTHSRRIIENENTLY